MGLNGAVSGGRFFRGGVAVVMSVALASACSRGSTEPPVVDPTVPGVGELPGERTLEIDRLVIPESSVPVSAPAVRPADLDLPTIGQEVSGNRLIVIGDSIIASTAPRFGGSLCDVLVGAGWTVEIDAEPGRFLSFADRVLDRRLVTGDGFDWSAAVMFFGSNFDGDLDGFAELLDELIGRLGPRPVLLLTVTEFREDRASVNEVIRARAGDRVRIIDWAKITAAEPGLLASDGLHLSAAGQNRLVTELALALGTTATLSSEGAGTCLPTVFTDDVLPTTVPD
jgi:hypothetical protein